VTMRSDLTDAEIDAYIQLGEARGCAGGYMIERRGAWLVESIDGDWLNVVGLPVLHVVSRLRDRGWRVTL
jgi:septum formation protein